MSQISSGVGLVSGFPIASTVQKLISLDSGPVNNLTGQNTTLSNQSTALTSLEAQTRRDSIGRPGAGRHLDLHGEHGFQQQ